MRTIQQDQTFNPPGKSVVVTTLAAKCDQCGSVRVLANQIDENLSRLRARKEAYGKNFLGEEIFEFRRKYGLSQPAASQIFGKGKIAFSRYENEKTFPDESTRKLLGEAMKFSMVLKDLADDEGVEIPLWNTRCAEEKAAKVVRIKPVEPAVIQEDAFEFSEGLPELDALHVPSLGVAFG